MPFDFFFSRLGSDVVIQRARLGLLDVRINQDAHDDILKPAKATADADAVTFADRAIRFRMLAVDIDLAAFAGAFGFRARLEQTRHIQPDVEALGLHASDEDFDLAFGAQAADE